MLARVKVLILGNSQDTGAFVEEGAKRHYIIRDRLAEEFGEPVEIAVRNAWPNSRMTDYVAKAVEDVDPDLVYVNMTAYPFSYESLPLRIKRVFGRVGGEKVGDAGMRMADSRRWSHNAVFRRLRRIGQATIGGDTHFTPEEVLGRYQELVRILVRREGLVVAVKGPASVSGTGTKRELKRKEARRQRVHQPMKAFCKQLHVSYFGTDEPLYKSRPIRKGTTVGDGLHSNAEGHRDSADNHYPWIRDAWRISRK